MDQILRDPLWQFIGAIVALIALCATVAIFHFQRKRKVLSYQVTSSSSLLSVREEVEGKIKILYEGTPIWRVHLVVVRIHNSGNVPIQKSDYERPLSISFGEDSRILSAEVTETSPENLDVTIDPSEDCLILEPLLLNSRDSITLKVLVSEFRSDLEVDARIVGVKQVRCEDTRYTPSLLVISAGCLLGIGGAIYEISEIGSRPPRSFFGSGKVSIGIAACILGYTLIFIGFLTNRTLRKRFFESLRRAFSVDK